MSPVCFRWSFVVAALVVGGCAVSPPVEIPLEAELIWLGPVPQSSEVGDISPFTHQQAGQLYLVDDASGKVVGVNSVNGDHPRFQFNGIEPSTKKFRLYFVPQAESTSRPAVIQR